MKLEQSVGQMQGSKEQPDGVRLALKLFNYCRDPEECGRTATRERQYELANANVALRIARNALNPPAEKDDWTQDCLFADLCSSKLKTLSVIPDAIGTP
jgi:hypothetical protein